MKKFFYRVQRGDGVFSVAEKFGVPATAIVNSNALTREISEGDILLIERASDKTYAVRPFDTIKNVAQKFGVTEEALEAANGTDYMFYGLIAVIPD